MKIRIRDQREFFAGLFFLIIGMTWCAASFLYPIGQATNMGSGYFPLVVSLVLAFLGLCAIWRGLNAEDIETVMSWEIMPLLFIFGGIAFFSLCIDRIGLVASSFGLVVIASYRQIWLRPREVLALACFTAVFVVILFVYVLKLNIDLF